MRTSFTPFPFATAVRAVCAVPLLTTPAFAFQCPSSTGPDVMVVDLVGVKRWGTVGDITGYSIGSNACNIGDERLEWFDDTNRHPVIAQNLYRLRNGRFEQIGMSWLKHGFYALAHSWCCPCQNPNNPNYLGIGCSDAYDANLNGDQGGFNGVAGLGPRSEVNPVTGEYPFPYGSQGEIGNAIYKRLQVHNDDLDPDQNAGALYFAELHYIAPDDAAANNDRNNASYLPVHVGSFQNGGWNLSYSGPPEPTKPAIRAWKDADPSVSIVNIDIPGDGRLILGYKVTDNGDGTWHYEYALQNFNSHRAARMFRIPLPNGVDVDSVNFHDVHYHSGEPYEGTNWSEDTDNGYVRWQTDTFEDTPNANALRWSTTYNFRFNADTPPTQVSATIGLFRPGSDNAVSASALGPSDPEGNPPPPPPPPPPGNPPPNDVCADAITIDLGSTDFTNAEATMSGPQVSCANSISHDVWFKFRSTFTGRLRVTTCGSVNFDSVLTVYDGCSCNDLDRIACSNNAGGCGGGSSKVTVNVRAGRCYLIRVAGNGNDSGTGTLRLIVADDDNAASANRIYTGASDDDQLGFAVAVAGRVDGDDRDEIIVGAHRTDQSGQDSGEAYVFSISTSDALSTFSGSDGEAFGRAVAGGCDVNNDGVDDVIIGAPYHDIPAANAGAVYAFSGADSTLLWIKRGQAAGDRMGWSVASAGDANDDGWDDVVVGAPYNDAHGTNAGRAYVLFGQDGSIMHIVSGQNPGDFLGTAVAGIGDVNNDGKDDFAAGAPNSDHGGSNAGRVSIFSGHNGNVLGRLNGAETGERFGSAVSGRRFNKGGRPHVMLLVGAPYSDAGGSSSGRVRAYLRDVQSPDCSSVFCLERTINGRNGGDRFGTSVAVADVVNGSMPDLIVGAPGSDLNGGSSGAVYIYDGGDGRLEERLHGEAAGDLFGQAVSVAGDMNGDNENDIVIGAPYNDAGGNRAGRAYVFFADNGAFTLTAARAAPGEPAPGEPDALNDPTEDDSSDPADAAVLDEPADLNGDDAVDAEDLLGVLEHWGDCAPDSPCPDDLTRDGRIDAGDLLGVLSKWGSITPR